MKRLVLCAFMAATPLSAQVSTGLYDPRGQCTGTTDATIEVFPTEIVFWESRCSLSEGRPLPGMGGAAQYSATCSGEGTTWTRELVLMQAEDGGLILMGPGYVVQYQRC